MTNDRKKVATPAPAIDEASAESPLRTLPPPRAPSIPIDVDLEAFAATAPALASVRDSDDEETETRQMPIEQRTRLQQVASLLTGNEDGDEEETATRQMSPEQKARINALAASKPPPQPVDATPTERLRKRR